VAAKAHGPPLWQLRRYSHPPAPLGASARWPSLLCSRNCPTHPPPIKKSQPAGRAGGGDKSQAAHEPPGRPGTERGGSRPLCRSEDRQQRLGIYLRQGRGAGMIHRLNLALYTCGLLRSALTSGCPLWSHVGKGEEAPGLCGQLWLGADGSGASLHCASALAARLSFWREPDG
jgi:hypothetical protein